MKTPLTQYDVLTAPVFVPDFVPAVVTVDKWFAQSPMPTLRARRNPVTEGVDVFDAALGVAPAPTVDLWTPEITPQRMTRPSNARMPSFFWDSRTISVFDVSMFAGLYQPPSVPVRARGTTERGSFVTQPAEPVYAESVFSSGDVVEFVLRIDQLHETTLSISQLGSFVLRVDQAADFTLER